MGQWCVLLYDSFSSTLARLWREERERRERDGGGGGGRERDSTVTLVREKYDSHRLLKNTTTDTRTFYYAW